MYWKRPPRALHSFSAKDSIFLCSITNFVGFTLQILGNVLITTLPVHQTRLHFWDLILLRKLYFKKPTDNRLSLINVKACQTLQFHYIKENKHLRKPIKARSTWEQYSNGNPSMFNSIFWTDFAWHY